MQEVRIALVGDYHADVIAHQTIPKALELAGNAQNIEVCYQWLATDSDDLLQKVADVQGIWLVPASPFRDMDSARDYSLY